MDFIDRIKGHPSLVALRQRVTAHRQCHRLGSAVRALAAAPTPIPESVLSSLITAWGDTRAINEAFLHACMVEAAQTRGPILQCGAGVNTLLLAVLAQRTGGTLWTLEHNSECADRVRRVLKTYGFTGAHVVTANAELFDDDYVWYLLDSARLPRGFSLVVCDGNAALPSSSRGTLTRLGDRLDHRAVILIRDARRPRDITHATQWAKARSAPCLVKGKRQPYIKIALRDQTPAEDLAVARMNTAFAS